MSPAQCSDIDVGGVTCGGNGPVGVSGGGHHGPTDTGKLMNSSAAAAFSQAVAAMQSLRSMQQARTSLLVNAAHPHSQLLATQAALLQNSTHPASVLLNGSLQKTLQVSFFFFFCLFGCPYISPFDRSKSTEICYFFFGLF